MVDGKFENKFYPRQILGGGGASPPPGIAAHGMGRPKMAAELRLNPGEQ